MSAQAHPSAATSNLDDAFQRFQARQHHNRQVHTETLENLAAILNPQRAHSTVAEGPPLMIAARAVGAALGVPIAPPAASEDLNTVADPFEAIARASRLRVRRVRLTENWWRQDAGPLLAYTRDDHQPVALLPVSATRYDLFDPVRNTRTRVDAHLASTLTSHAYTVYRALSMSTPRWLDLLRFGLWGHLQDVCLALLMGVAATVLGMIVPQATALLIDSGIPDADHVMIYQLGAALLAAAFGQTLLQLTQGFALMRQTIAAGAALQAAMWDRLLTLRPPFFRQYTTGDLLARVTAVTSMQQRLGGAILPMLVTSCLTLLNLALMLHYDVSLALIALVVTLVASLVTATAGVVKVRYMRPLQRLSGELMGRVVQLIDGVAKLRVAGAEERAFAYWGTYYNQHQTLAVRVQRIEDGMTVINALLPTLASVLLLWGAMRGLPDAVTVGHVGLSTGTFLAFYTAFGTLMGGATNLSNTLIDLLDVATLWERAKPIVTAPPEVDATRTDPGRLTGKLAIDQVTFRYQEDGPMVLDNISIHAAPGEFIALVGPSGSGKSTLLRLLSPFGRVKTPAFRRQL